MQITETITLLIQNLMFSSLRNADWLCLLRIRQQVTMMCIFLCFWFS